MLDTESFGKWLLEWLSKRPLAEQVKFVESQKNPLIIHNHFRDWENAGDFLKQLGLSSSLGPEIIQPLYEQKLVDAYGSIFDYWQPRLIEDNRIRITIIGIAYAEENRRHRYDAADLGASIPKRMLCWTYENEEQPEVLANFLVSSYASQGGRLTVKMQTCRKVALELQNFGLVKLDGIPYDEFAPTRHEDLGPTIALTQAGAECTSRYNGDIAAFTNAQQNNVTAGTTSINIERATQTIIGNRNSISTVRLDPSGEVHRFAEFVIQVSSLLHAPGTESGDFFTQASDVDREAASDRPDMGRLQRMTKALLTALANAAPQALADTAVDLGEKALHALGA